MYIMVKQITINSTKKNILKEDLNQERKIKLTQHQKLKISYLIILHKSLFYFKFSILF